MISSILRRTQAAAPIPDPSVSNFNLEPFCARPQFAVASLRAQNGLVLEGNGRMIQLACWRSHGRAGNEATIGETSGAGT